jgi:hypothetical protein
MGAMTPEVLFTAALQLEAGWKVTECRFEGEPRRLLLKLDFEQGKRVGCPQCGKLCPTHDTSTKRWRHLNFFSMSASWKRGCRAAICQTRSLERGVPLGAEGMVLRFFCELAMPCAGDAWRRCLTLWESTTRSGGGRPIMSKQPTPRVPGQRCDESRLTRPVPGESIAT